MKIIALVLLMIACGGGKKAKTKADLDAEYGAKLKPRMEALVKAGSVADQNRSSLGTIDGSRDTRTGPTDLDVDYNEEPPAGNTVIVQFDDLTSLTEDAKPALRFAELDNDYVRTAKLWTGASLDLSAGDWSKFEPTLQRVIGAKYVLVVFPTLVAAPSMGLGGTTFTTGQATATVVLVEIDGGKPHGGFEIQATNKPEILTKQASGLGASEQKQRKVEADLAAQLGIKISDGIRKRWPGAKAPYNWGFGY